MQASLMLSVQSLVCRLVNGRCHKCGVRSCDTVGTLTSLSLWQRQMDVNPVDVKNVPEKIRNVKKRKKTWKNKKNV